MAKETGWGMHTERFPQQELRHLPTFAKVIDHRLPAIYALMTSLDVPVTTRRKHCPARTTLDAIQLLGIKVM
jgi:hypothetical protein